MKKILLIRFSSLGDLVILSSVLEMLKTEDVEVHLLTYSEFEPVFENDTRVGRILKLPHPYGIEDVFKIVKVLRSEKYDMVFDLQRKFLSLMLLALSGSKKFVYSNRRRERKGALKGKKITGVPVYELYAAPVKRALGIRKPTPCPVLRPVRVDMTLPDNYIVIAPGARHRTKIWPYYGELVRLIKTHIKGVEIFAVGDRKDHELVKPYGDDVIDMTGKTTIPELFAVISRSRLVVSNDSAPMHIGSAYGVPVVAFFGPTIPEFGFRPCNAYIFETPLECRPCSLHGTETCPLGHFRCMRSIRPERVLGKIKEILRT